MNIRFGSATKTRLEKDRNCVVANLSCFISIFFTVYRKVSRGQRGDEDRRSEATVEQLVGDAFNKRERQSDNATFLHAVDRAGSHRSPELVDDKFEYICIEQSQSEREHDFGAEQCVLDLRQSAAGHMPGEGR